MTDNGAKNPVPSIPFIQRDPDLAPYFSVIARRLENAHKAEKRLTRHAPDLIQFASGHDYFGLRFVENQWVFREWAPHASAVWLLGRMTDWQVKPAFALERKNDAGVWEIRLPQHAVSHGDHYRIRLQWPGGGGDRIPAWARRVVQDAETLIFNAQVWCPTTDYRWEVPHYRRPDNPPLIYEAHVGMAQDCEKIGTYREFTENIIPRVVDAGYNTLQLMAIQEHPYYGSFGYQVSSFFAASSRFGTPEDLKKLIDTAHDQGLAVVMDLVHSHAVANEVEGLGRFDGTLYQYFHDGPRGWHNAWGSRCFDYGKDAVLHFLLSNCRFWLEEYHIDGFRFDGITSMLYLHHGLEKAFVSYDDYFDANVDEDALTYLTLANRLIHGLRPDAITMAEDVSGMPGLAASAKDGGVGFDYRFAMGIPDNWIRLAKDVPDDAWPMGSLWYELTNRRNDEKTVSYTESHDQALVGDQTLLFRMVGSDMYDRMGLADESLLVERGMALHKMIRLITLATAGNGYLNFMGNEFGHPEWIDFPREGNGWSFQYARRRWHLVDDVTLKYRFLADFDRDTVHMATSFRIMADPDCHLLHEHDADKVLVFQRAGLIFAFNFHGSRSHVDYRVAAPPGQYRMILDSDHGRYGGFNRLTPGQTHFTCRGKSGKEPPHFLSLYLPTRTAIVLEFTIQNKM